MSKWKIIRLAFVAFAFLASALDDQVPVEPDETSVLLLLAVFIFGILGLLFIIGLQRFNPFAAKSWRYPDWTINPFQMREPLQFFHFGGHFMLASGVGALLHQAFAGPASFNSGAMLLAYGLGILCGVRACTIAYRSKMLVGDLRDTGNER